VLQLILILILMTTLPHPAFLTIPPQGVMVGSVLLAGMFVGGIWSGLVPVVSSQSLIEQARQESMTYHSAYDAMSRLNRATQTDDLSATPYRDLAQLHFAQWQTQFQDASDLFQLGVEALQQAIARDPRSPKDYRSLSEWWQKRYERTQNRDDAITALQAAQRAVELYPNDSRMQRQLAIAAQIADEPAIAQQASRTALQLDDINRQRGHVDKFLTESQRQELLKIQGE
jgi:tetratricopeptide (TPR) repeat protein